MFFVGLCVHALAQDLISTRPMSESEASTQPKHMHFMGISMDTEFRSFVNALKQKRFEEFMDLERSIVLKGRFAGYDDCKIIVYSSPSNKVKLVGVFFPNRDNWSHLYANYSNIKNMLIQKYGEPELCDETFESVVDPQDDHSKMFYVETDRCKYKTRFHTSGGWIILAIEHMELDTCVTLGYSDDVYIEEDETAAIDDL